MIAVDTALLDRHLFGAALGSSPDTWATWLTVLRAAFASPLDRRDNLHQDSGSPQTTAAAGAGAVLRGRDAQREKQNDRGARGLTHKLARGETGYVLVLSPRWHKPK
jgi:hypothetical protein